MNTKKSGLPKISVWLLEHVISREVRYSALGDFEELFRHMEKERGTLQSRL